MSRWFPFWPRSIENRAAIRTTVAALGAVLIAFSLHIPSPYWSGMSVVIVTNLYTGSIVDKAFLRISGTILGAIFGFIVAGLVVNSFLLYLLSCFLIIAVSVYYYHYSAHGYAYLLGALCAFIVISQLAVDPGNSFMVAIWRPTEIGIGVLAFALAVYSVFPNHLKDATHTQINDLFDDFIDQYQQIEAYLNNEKSKEQVLSNNFNIRKKLRKAIELIGAMNHEWGVTQVKTDELRALLSTFYELSRQMHYFLSLSYTQADRIKLTLLPTNELFAAINEDLKQLQQGFANPGFVINPLEPPSEMGHLEERVQQKAGASSHYLFSLLLFVRDSYKRLSMIQTFFTQGHASQENSLSKPNIQFINKQERMRLDSDLIKHCIKAGLTVLLALSFWLLTNWPGGINGIISSLVISIKRNLFEMKYVIIHRLLGCLIGGGLALIALACIEMNLYDLIVILFLAVWGFTYCMFKFPKYSYIGLQANIALIITLAQEGGPPVLLGPPLQRLAGIVIGIVASFIVANVLWRSDVWTMLTRYVEKIYSYLVFNLTQVLASNDEPRRIHDLASLFWLVRGLIESLSESQLSAAKQKKLDPILSRFESLVSIQATISYILSAIDKSKTQAAALLLHIDLVSYETRLVQCYATDNIDVAHDIEAELHCVLSQLGKKPSYAAVGYQDLTNLVAYINALKQLALGLKDYK